MKLHSLNLGSIKKYGMLIALFVLIVFFYFVTEGTMLLPANITNIIQQNGYILILAIGMLFCILTGNIDLSVGSIVAVVGAIAGYTIITLQLPVALGIIISLIMGTLIGALQGYFIAYLKIPAFIVTLAGMLIFRGITMVILSGATIAPFPESFQFVAAGFILPNQTLSLFGQESNIFALIFGILFCVAYILFELKNRKAKIKYGFETGSDLNFYGRIALVVVAFNFITFKLSLYKGIPFILLLLIVLVLIYSFIAVKTIPGRHVYAIGGNEKAARLSGVKTQKVMFWVYANMGLLAAIAGIVVAGRLNAATPKAGNGYELDAIASCFIGGASASGGIGTVVGAVIGGFVMAVLNNGMSIEGIGTDWQQIIKGVVLVIAVLFDIKSKSKASNAN
ncbi:MAG: multiple monosaccharide ABC transporter permease [Lachnospirales bacterium]